LAGNCLILHLLYRIERCNAQNVEVFKSASKH
jgi:hypothetical protein